jgi:hypothetical protein
LAPYRTIHRRADAHFEQIEVTSLDQDLAEAHLPEPDLIKVEAEGYELAVPGEQSACSKQGIPRCIWK